MTLTEARQTFTAEGNAMRYTAEDMAAAGEQFDVVLNMEVVEHVADPQAYLTACQQLLKPGGLMICSTLNRNPKSFVMAIVGAEYMFRVLPRGTHRWSQFVRPAELHAAAQAGGLTSIDLRGMRYLPVLHRAAWVRGTSVNYIAAFERPA